MESREARGVEFQWLACCEQPGVRAVALRRLGTYLDVIFYHVAFLLKGCFQSSFILALIKSIKIFYSISKNIFLSISLIDSISISN